MISDHLGGAISSTFLQKLRIHWKTAEPRFCETLQCFHHILGDMTLPESTIKQKPKPSEISLILSMTKRVPGRIFQDFKSSFGTISEHISQLFQASFSSTQKCKKSERQVLARGGYPRRITEEGGTRKHPEAPKAPRRLQEALDAESELPLS